MVKSAYKQWTRSHRFRWKPGRPKAISAARKEEIAHPVADNRRMSVRAAMKLTSSLVSQESIRTIRHENGYHFYETIPVSPLTEDAKLHRVAFCNRAGHARHHIL
jgi:hypothetical protein